MKKKSLIIFVIFFLLVISLISHVYAITGSIGNSKISVSTGVDQLVERYVIIRNLNNETIRIQLTATGDLENYIDFSDNNFTIEPNGQKNAFFSLTPDKVGNFNTKLYVKFIPTTGSSVTLFSTLTVIVNENRNDSYIFSKLQDHDNKLSGLFSWKDSVTNSLQNILNSINSLTSKSQDHENRLIILEESTSNNGSGCSCQEFPSYLKYLNSNDKKDILCGYATERHLTNITKIGMNCDLTYKTIGTRERVNCKCK